MDGFEFSVVVIAAVLAFFGYIINGSIQAEFERRRAEYEAKKAGFDEMIVAAGHCLGAISLAHSLNTIRFDADDEESMNRAHLAFAIAMGMAARTAHRAESEIAKSISEDYDEVRPGLMVDVPTAAARKKWKEWAESSRYSLQTFLLSLVSESQDEYGHAYNRTLIVTNHRELQHRSSALHSSLTKRALEELQRGFSADPSDGLADENESPIPSEFANMLGPLLEAMKEDLRSTLTPSLSDRWMEWRQRMFGGGGEEEPARGQPPPDAAGTIAEPPAMRNKR